MERWEKRQASGLVSNGVPTADAPPRDDFAAKVAEMKQLQGRLIELETTYANVQKDLADSRDRLGAIRIELATDLGLSVPSEPDEVAEQVAVLKERKPRERPSQNKVLAALSDGNERHVVELGHMTGLGELKANKAAWDLERAGLLERTQKGRYKLAGCAKAVA